MEPADGTGLLPLNFCLLGGGVRDLCDSGLRCSWLTVLRPATYIIRRGIERTPLESAERAIFKDGGHVGGRLDRFSPLYRCRIHDLPLGGELVILLGKVAEKGRKRAN